MIVVISIKIVIYYLIHTFPCSSISHRGFVIQTFFKCFVNCTTVSFEMAIITQVLFCGIETLMTSFEYIIYIFTFT